MYYYVYTAMQIPAGVLADTLGPRICAGVGSLVAGVGSIVFGLPATATATAAPSPTPTFTPTPQPEQAMQEAALALRARGGVAGRPRREAQEGGAEPDFC